MKFGKKKTEKAAPSVLSGDKAENGEFLRSLDAVTPSELSRRATLTKDRLLRRSFLGAVRYTSLIACALVFIASCSALIYYGFQYYQNKQDTDFLQNFWNEEGADDGLVTVDSSTKKSVITLSIERSMAGEVIGNVGYEDGEYNEYFETMRSKLYSLKRQNSDVWGWITVPNTDIDFPIMKTTNNDYYLYRNFLKEYNRNGSIFADYRTKTYLEDNRNLVIYGHNMASTQSMFAPLLEFTQEDVFQNRPVIVITMDGIYTYSVFSVYDTSASYNYIQTYFSSNDAYLAFIQKCIDNSLYKKDIEITSDSSILTLSTCTVRQDNRRWAIHAVLTGISK